jgi:hypothetical protein
MGTAVQVHKSEVFSLPASEGVVENMATYNVGCSATIISVFELGNWRKLLDIQYFSARHFEGYFISLVPGLIGM